MDNQQEAIKGVIMKQSLKDYPNNLVINFNTKRFKTLMLWLNSWGNIYDSPRLQDKSFNEGYKQAISDVFDYCQKYGYKKGE